MVALPSVLLETVKKYEQTFVGAVVACDTETSGLHVDDGARISTVSLGWSDQLGTWSAINKKHKLGLTIKPEEIAPGYVVDVVSVAWPFDQGVAGTGKPEDHGQETLWAEADNLPLDEWIALLKLLTWLGKKAGLTWHNAKFDLHMFVAGCRRWPEVGKDFSKWTVWDTQNGNSALYPLLQDPVSHIVTTSLKPSCMAIFGVSAGDEQKVIKEYLRKARLPSGRWDLMPWDVIHMYADNDARLTVMLRLRQEHDIANGVAGVWFGSPEEAYEALDRRLRVTRLLFRMEEKGLPYDELTSRETARECASRALTQAERLPFRPTEPAAKHYYFGDGKTDKGVKCLDLVPYSVTEKGNPSLTAEILQRMVADNMPFASEFAQYQKASNAASMWYSAYADAMGPDGRLRTNFRQNGTRSHRFSVERVNLQAIPQDYRLEGYPVLDGLPTPRDLIGLGLKQFPGWKLWELDLAQAELRVAAMFANCKKMLQMINDGADLHDYTTAELFDMDPSHKHWFQHRQIGKRGNFSLIFGSGPGTFKAMISKEIGLILDDAVAYNLVKDWNRLYPEFEDAIDKHMARVQYRQARHGKGWIDLRNKERRWFEEYEDAHKSFNQRVQPNLAQFGIDWMLESEDILNDSKIQKQADEQGVGGVGLLLTIHDSQVIMAPDNEYGAKVVEACAQAGRDLWVKTFPEVPGDVDAKPFRKD